MPAISTPKNVLPCLVSFVDPQRCTQVADICLIIDSSGSITEHSDDNWRLMREFLSSLVDYFTVGHDQTRFGAVVFSDAAKLEFALNRYNDAESVKRALMSLKHLRQETNTPDAIQVAREQCFNVANGDRPEIQNVAIIVTDGVPHPANRRNPAIAQAHVLRSYNTRMIAVGITDRIDMDFLKEMSSQPQKEGKDFFRSADFTALDQISKTVADVGCATIPPRKKELCMFKNPYFRQLLDL